MKKIIFLTSILLLLNFIGFSQWTVKTVPNPKTTGAGFVANPDTILTEIEVTYLDSIIQEVQDSSKAEIAVVMLQSIGNETPKTFATELFNFWGIGNAETDNGLLILFVMDQRRIEFETGYGIEQILSDAKCYEIQQKFMVPKFKKGNYGQGIIDGTTEIVQIFMGRAEEITPADTESTPNTDNYNYDHDYQHYNHSGFYGRYYKEIYYYLRILAFAVGLFFLLFIISIINKDYFARYQTIRIFRLYIWFILFPVPFIAIYFFVIKISEKWRNTPRISAKTGLVMHKLTETEDDRYLEKGQVAEEKVKSVDYDVWISGEEGDVLIQSYKRWFSKYNSCPKCKYKTYYKVYDKVISSATYSSSGKGEKYYKCTNCGHSRTVTYIIPKKTKTSSSSSSSWSSGGSSSWSSGGSSSWGGGSSGGGGAGSSW
ncbi:MAG: TPM domain-containing protein [Bacteroidales bacterium]|nr:TPM domain-containing protein [Bacteroidales bacterium]